MGQCVSCSDSLGLHLCFLQMMWSCWLYQAETSSRHWGDSQPSVKQTGWELARPSLRPLSSVQKGWIAHSMFEVSPYLKWRSIWGYCSWVQHLQWCRHCTGLLSWSESWVGRQSYGFTSRYMFQTRLGSQAVPSNQKNKSTNTSTGN